MHHALNPQYNSIRDAINNNQLTSFADFLKFHPASQITSILEIDNDELMKLTKDPALMQVKHLIRLSDIFQVDFLRVVTAVTGKRMD